MCTPTEIRAAPRSIVQAQFSIPYNIACALIHGRVLLGHFTDEALCDPEVMALAAKVACRVDAEIERGWGRTVSPTHIVAEMDGGVLESRVDLPRGHPTAPMTAADTDTKLRDCLAFGGVVLADGSAERLSALIGKIEERPDMRELLSVLTPKAA